MTKRPSRKPVAVKAIRPTHGRATSTVSKLGRPRRHTVMVLLTLVFLVTLTVVTWPQLTLMFSDAKPAVESLSNDVIYVDPAAKPVDIGKIRGIVGTRPVAILDLAASNPAAAHPLDLCTEVTDRLDDILVMVIVDGAFDNGCEGDGLPIVGDRDGFDFGFWYDIDNSTTFLDGDIALQAQQLALQYDSEVAGGTLHAAERSYQAPVVRLLLAIGIALGVVAAVLFAFVLLRRSAAIVVHRREVRRAWRDRLDDLESEVSSVALSMVGPQTDLRQLDKDAIDRAGLLAQQYLSVLDDLEKTQSGDDLTALAGRVAGLVAAAGGKQ